MYGGHLDLSPSAQEGMVSACEAAMANPNLVEASEGFCLLKDVKAMDPNRFPYPTVPVQRGSHTHNARTAQCVYTQAHSMPH